MSYEILANRKRFIWLWGVCGFGLASALWTSIDDVRAQLSEAPPDWLALAVTIPMNVLVYGLVAGYAWGWIMWHVLSMLRDRLDRRGV